MKPTKTLTNPTLYLQCEADGVNPPAASKQVPEKFSGRFELVLLPGVGHFPQREAPDEVARGLVAHFATAGGG